MPFLQSAIGQRILITLLALAALATSRFVPDFKELLGMTASAMFAWAWLRRPGDDAPAKSKAPSIPPGAGAALFLASVMMLVGCAELSRAERVRYGLKAIKASCNLAGVYPAEVPAEVKPELDEVCLALGAAKAEHVNDDAGTP